MTVSAVDLRIGRVSLSRADITESVREQQAMLRVIARLKQEGIRGKMAGASCCTLCERCAILDSEPCRDPERQFSCMSAYCIYVKALAETCGMEYTCSDGRLALFGLYAF